MVGRGGNETVGISDGMLLGGKEGLGQYKKRESNFFLVQLNTSSFNEL